MPALLASVRSWSLHGSAIFCNFVVTYAVIMSKLDNFKGRRHEITTEDRIKGGKAASLVRLEKNVITRKVNDYIRGVGEFEGCGMIDDLRVINPKDRLNFMMAFLPFEIPKLQAVEQIIEVSKSDRSKEEIEKEIFAILEVNKS